MADKIDLKKLEVIADMLAEDGKPGKVLDGWTLVPANKSENNPALADVYADVKRKLPKADVSADFVLARQKGEQGVIAKLFATEMPDDNASKVFSEAEKKGAKDTTGEKKAEAK